MSLQGIFEAKSSKSHDFLSSEVVGVSTDSGSNTLAAIALSPSSLRLNLDIAVAKAIRTRLMAETLARISSAFCLLPSASCLLLEVSGSFGTMT